MWKDSNLYLGLVCPEMYLPKYFIPIINVVEKADYTTDNTGDKYADLQSAEDFSFSIEIKIHKGARDILMGKDTPAARRYIRSEKRRKEKERRNRLKYGIRKT